jgi:hypothetical protein
MLHKKFFSVAFLLFFAISHVFSATHVCLTLNNETGKDISYQIGVTPAKSLKRAATINLNLQSNNNKILVHLLNGEIQVFNGGIQQAGGNFSMSNVYKYTESLCSPTIPGYLVYLY